MVITSGARGYSLRVLFLCLPVMCVQCLCSCCCAVTQPRASPVGAHLLENVSQVVKQLSNADLMQMNHILAEEARARNVRILVSQTFRLKVLQEL